MQHPARSAIAAASLALALTAVPNIGAQAHHCQEVIMFSGVSAQGAYQPAPNVNVGGCLTDDENLNTNLIQPGATWLQVRSYPRPVSATVNIDGVDIPLTMTAAGDGSSWSSQRITVSNPQVATATVATPIGHTITVTYTARPTQLEG